MSGELTVVTKYQIKWCDEFFPYTEVLGHLPAKLSKDND